MVSVMPSMNEVKNKLKKQLNEARVKEDWFQVARLALKLREVEELWKFADEQE